MSGADLAQSLQNQKNIEFIEAVEKNDREKADRYIPCLQLLYEPYEYSFSNFTLYDFPPRLLRQGAQINVACNQNGCRALHIVCSKQQGLQPHHFLKMLLDPKYDPDLEPQTYFLKLRPLHCAISARNRQCVLQLLQVNFLYSIIVIEL
jgi:hypothetical protein